MARSSAFAALLKVQALASARSFASTFYSIILPSFLFVIFGLVFRIDAEYAVFFLPGMMGVMASSDALFAVGPVIKAYYQQGIVREFKNYPVPTAWLFITFIMVRLVVVAISSALLVALSALLFGYLPGPGTLALYGAGVILCFAIYAFLALAISFWGARDGRDQGLISAYYFLGMFLSDAYFVLSARGAWLDAVGYAFPLKPVLQIMRGDASALLPAAIWAVLSVSAALFILSRVRFARAA